MQIGFGLSASAAVDPELRMNCRKPDVCSPGMTAI
jgi:hypothetical protein